ncbi:MAG: hypothetical protein BWY70_01692 [Bacteroidetes bacterium ADurb.Bin408]|nr:MAG: hypothetical protein BWY70_01692 [Bacteroidetes bacterium ADurb.Bin408]
MVPQSCFKDNSEAGHAIYKYIDTLAIGKKLWLRPYNRYMPEVTEWWLIPDKEWPAYHNGKLLTWAWHRCREFAGRQQKTRDD